MMCQKNREGWLVGVWDGNRWDPSHAFRISSHSHPTRRCTVILPKHFAFEKALGSKFPTHADNIRWTDEADLADDPIWRTRSRNWETQRKGVRSKQIRSGVYRTSCKLWWLALEAQLTTRLNTTSHSPWREHLVWLEEPSSLDSQWRRDCLLSCKVHWQAFYQEEYQAKQNYVI